MNIAIIGLGYVGLSTALALASKGHQVYGYDINQEKISRLKLGEAPFHEELVDQYLQETLEKTFFVEGQLEKAIIPSDVIIVCVNTPSLPDGRMNDSYLVKAIKNIAVLLQSLEDEKYRVIVIKSTVVPGTTRRLKHLLEVDSRKVHDQDFGMAMMPEFLRQGRALKDSLNPSRIICGVFSEKERRFLSPLIESFSVPSYFVTPETAEFVKYATNSFLALKISFTNELANIITHFLTQNPRAQVNVDDVITLMGLDPRINTAHMKAGIGFGGSCFPKDVRALVALAEACDYQLHLIPQVLHVNDLQPQFFIRMLREHLGMLKNKNIAVLGLAFKPGTDDIREAPSLNLISHLLAEGARITAYDPKAMMNFKKVFPEHENLRYATTVASAVEDVDAAILVTEWKEIVEFLGTLTSRDFLLVDGRGVLKNPDVSLGKNAGVGESLIHQHLFNH